VFFLPFNAARSGSTALLSWRLPNARQACVRSPGSLLPGTLINPPTSRFSRSFCTLGVNISMSRRHLNIERMPQFSRISLSVYRRGSVSQAKKNSRLQRTHSARTLYFPWRPLLEW
jgi:hypothetical protein